MRTVRLSFIAVMLVGCTSAGTDPIAPRSSSAPVAGVVRANTSFAVDLYGKLRTKPGNLFLSPASISSALAMTYAGARGETAEQMAHVLHFDGADVGDVHAGYATLRARWLTPDAKGPELGVANRLFGQRGLRVEPAFLHRTRDGYGAPMQLVDFAGQAEQARGEINGWVEEQTHDRIKDLLTRGTITGGTRLVLVNAIYFKGRWATRFSPNSTTDEPFFVSSDRTVPTPMMHAKVDAGYTDTSDAQVLALPYASGEDGRRLSLVVVVPKEKDGLAEMEESLDAEDLEAWTGVAGRRSVEVTLPKFKATSTFELAPTLAAMGMELPFSAAADFSGITTQTGLTISNVVHKAFVDVNEEGTEAAAATAVVTVEAAVAVEQNIRVRADRPFLYLIRDDATKSVLFMGRYATPT